MYYIRPGLDALSTIFQRLFDPPYLGGGGVGTIRFAIGRFPGTDPDEFTWLETAGDPNLRNYSGMELSDILSALTIRWAGTPIGTAIRRPDGAIQMFDDNPYGGAGTTASVILLFTDGKRYGGLDIYDAGYGSGSGESHVAFRNDIDQYSDHTDDGKIKILSLGFGDFSEVDAETDFAMLEDISRYFDKYDPSLDSDIFTKIAINTAFSHIWGSSLTLTDPSFLIYPDSTREHITYITRYDKRLAFVVSWKQPRRDSTLKVTIKTDAGALIDPEFADTHPDIAFDAGRTFQMYTLQEPFLQQNIGQCRLIVDASHITEPEWYAYSILGFSGLQLTDASGPVTQPLLTGDSLQLMISLAADGNTVSDARTTARVVGPAEGAGNWFAGYHLTPSQLDSVRSLVFPGHVENVYKKYFYMRHLNGVGTPGIDTLEVPLIYDDETQLYCGASPDLTVPGIYKVEILATHGAEGRDPYFERSLTLNYHVGVSPDLEWRNSTLQFEKTAGEEGHDIYRARITPRDRYLNFLRPGKEHNFRFRLENAQPIEDPVADDLEGSYYKWFVVPTNAIRPMLHIEYDDFVFQERVITDDPKGDNWRVNPSALSLHIGTSSPTGKTANTYGAGILAAIDFNRHLNRRWALRAIVGLNRLSGKAGIDDMEYVNISANLRWMPFVNPAYRLYIGAGGGAYLPDRGSNRAGYNVGVGLTIPLSVKFDISMGSDYQRVLTPGDDTEFAGLHGGCQIRF
jgi:hypothetical protein